MIYLNVLGEHFVILNSLEVISDLFEKRSSNYSDRKQTTMFELYVSHSFHLVENFSKISIDAERIGVEAWPLCHMAYGGEDIGNHFMSISTITR